MELLSNEDRANKIINLVQDALFNANNHVQSCAIFFDGTCDCGDWVAYVNDKLLSDFQKLKMIIKDADDAIYDLSSELEQHQRGL